MAPRSARSTSPKSRRNSPSRVALDRLELTIHDFDREQAYRAGLLRPPTKTAGLSFGDRACLALGQQLGLPVLTADRSWQSLSLGVAVRLVR